MSDSDQTPPSFPKIGGPAFVPPGPVARPASHAQPPPLPANDTALHLQSGSSGTSSRADLDANYSVGWLVVIAGPGRGRSLTLAPGMNHLGRAATNRLVLDFGDAGISSRTHTTVTYDPRGRKFYVQPGPDAVDLTYLGEGSSVQPVLAPTEISGGETIVLGQTHLKFVPFCGPDFTWE